MERTVKTFRPLAAYTDDAPSKVHLGTVVHKRVQADVVFILIVETIDEHGVSRTPYEVRGYAWSRIAEGDTCEVMYPPSTDPYLDVFAIDKRPIP